MATTTKPYIARWGIVATGWISRHFVLDLVSDPSDRGVSDIAHAVIAVGSRTKDKAVDFVAQHIPNGGWAQKCGLVSGPPEAVGSYPEVWNHKDVDIVYIGTPHTNHYEASLAALQAGKHVLCEKPITLNATEATKLFHLARSKKLFIVEGTWTRYFPLVQAFRDLAFNQKVVGDIKHVIADFSIGCLDTLADDSRLLSPALAGGALLDLGPYPLVWALMALYENPANERQVPILSGASMLKTPRTGVDIFTTWSLDFPKLGARADLFCNLATLNAPESVRIQGTKGEILVHGPPAQPTALTIRRREENSREFQPDEVIKYDIPGGIGLHWQADSVARSLRDGKLESSVVPHEASLLQMKIFDEIRKLAGYVYPDGLEKA